MTEPMKTAEQILIKHLGTAGCLETEDIEELTDEPGFIESVKAMDEYAAQQVAAERERIKMYMKGRLDKCESEIKDTSVDSDARRILQGHKYELSHLLKEIDSL